ncbi:dynamin family protein [Halobacillus mangrovi]|uniref:dynamin family protein n=1 Tax=Halobacillus mangrovi TaxID=402384 RepID=UPI003D990182
MALTTENAVESMKSLYAYMKEHVGMNHSEKILDIIEKLDNNKMMIGFAGHFSAGKSTLINTLLNREMLPSSPIPTSANIVQLKSGKPFTVAYFHNELPVKYEGTVDFDLVQALCKDGEEITRVDISHPESGLPEDVTVLDTPGVDSTNDADRLITESSLHLMDHMFYVMDYNHVQSEVNLQFLWEMQKRGTPFSLVINQIDKHNEKEISFQSFCESVENSLDQWGIAAEKIFYTSMRDFDLPHNGFEELKADFEALFKRPYELIENQAKLDVQSIVHECVREAKEDIDQDKQELIERKRELETIVENSHLSIDHPSTTEGSLQQANQDIEKRIFSFIPNAYLMPSALREDAKAFLESKQKEFKVGLLFSNKKTEEEKRIRKEKFFHHLDEVIEKNLKWPLRDRWMEIAEKHEVTEADFIQMIQEFPFNYKKDRLADLVQEGAEVTGEYILRYTDQVASDIKKEARRFSTDLQKQMEAAIQKEKDSDYQKHKEAYDALEKAAEVKTKLDHFDNRLKKYRDELYFKLESEASKEERELVERDLKKRNEQIQVGTKRCSEKKPEEPKDKISKDVDTSTPRTNEEKSIESVLDNVDRTLSNVKDIKGLEELVDQLKNKKERLRNRHYTVALFGAFSAGKSSFANALLGDKVLPVSPNPTTATINRISPPTEKHPDCSIQVDVKTESQMMDDLKNLLKRLGVNETDLESVYHALLTMPEKNKEYLEHKQYSFLQAFLEGFPDMKQHINQTITIPWELFSRYVSEEKTSCFIESMELYYDCPLTRAGVTLVDTPGADSANARHTDVSFEYIKDSDAVLFVTYYNHPFSKADQAFLTQLGRVKDSFAMDKMFFIINAKDLANSVRELNSVEEYLIDQLVRFQIRNPRLYSVSSLNGLKEKQGERTEPSNLDVFETEFHQFLEKELAEVLIHSIRQVIEEVSATLQEFIKNAELGENEREYQLSLFQEQKNEAISTLRDKGMGRGTETLKNKAEKQVFYAHERLMLQFNDLFKQHFNPATINGKDKDISSQLNEAKDKLVEEVNFEMKQELRAISLRIERLMEDLIRKRREDIQRELKKTRKSLRLNEVEWEPLDLPSFSSTVQLDEKKSNAILKQFKSTKAFFEKNEKESMKEDLSSMVSPLLKTAFEQALDVVNDHYCKYYEVRAQTYKGEWERQVRHTFDRLSYNLEHPLDTTKIEKAQKEMESMLF